METWQAIVAAGAAVAGALAWLRTAIKPFVPTLCELARTYINHMENVERREVLLMLVRAAEELLGPGRGNDKLEYVRAAAYNNFGMEFSDDEISAAAREATKERAAQPELPFGNSAAPP